MALDLVYPLSALTLAAVAATNMRALPYAAVMVVLALIWNAFQRKTPKSRKILKPDVYQNFELAEKDVISHNTATYRFKLPKPNDILGLPIGQHITVACTIDGKEISRSYTPTSSDDEPGRFDLLIKSYPTGNVSKYVGLMKIGDTIKVKGPKGQMVYRPGLVRAFGMIAGGTGITPMLQIIRAILKNPADKTQISLIFANVNEEDILLRKELEQLARDRADQFKLYLVLNNPPAEGWKGGVGFVTEQMIKEHCPKPAKDIKILMCGPPPMISAMKKNCVALGYDPAKVVSKLEDQVFAF